jgi:hypothetical protein
MVSFFVFVDNDVCNIVFSNNVVVDINLTKFCDHIYDAVISCSSSSIGSAVLESEGSFCSCFSSFSFSSSSSVASFFTSC